MIKEVIFDIDGTLYDYDKGHAEGMARMKAYAEKELGISGEEYAAEYIYTGTAFWRFLRQSRAVWRQYGNCATWASASESARI